jgi:hypothetical protein
MPRRLIDGLALVGATMLMLAAILLVASAAPGSSGRDGPAGTLEALLAVVGGLRPPSNGETRLLFPNVVTTDGSGTEVNISNTARDPYGTQGSAGACEVRLYGRVGGAAAAEVARTLPAAEPGATISWNVALGAVSTGGPVTSVPAVPDFFGYAVATCAFPLAHGFVFTALGGTVVSSTPALVLPSTRSTSFVEAAGQ